MEKRRAAKIFGKMVNPEMAKALVEGRWDPPPLQQSHIEFVTIFVCGTTAEEISPFIGRVLDIAEKHEAFIDFLSASVVVAAFGAQPHARCTPGARSELVADLAGQLGDKIKMVHGAGLGSHGVFGTGKSQHFGFFLPHFDSVLGLLGRIELGATQEFKP